MTEPFSISLDAEAVREEIQDRKYSPKAVEAISRFTDEEIGRVIDAVAGDEFWDVYDDTCFNAIEVLLRRAGLSTEESRGTNR